jgi:hypothetical protein
MIYVNTHKLWLILINWLNVNSMAENFALQVNSVTLYLGVHK